MCLSISSRSTTSAGAPRRPRLRLLACRLARASYTAATMSWSASTASACFIQASRRSLTSSAISPSPKLSCARRISIMLLAPPLRCGPVRTQQLMIKLANGLDRLLQVLIIAQPAAHLGNPLAPHAELARTSSRVGHRHDKHVMPFATRAFRASFGVTDGAFQQRAAQQLARDRQFADQLLARSEGPLSNHSKNESMVATNVNPNPSDLAVF